MQDEKESFKLQLKLADRSVPIIISGFLKKQGGSIRSWKKRWFILQNYSLKYFEITEKKSALKGEITLNEQYTAKDGDAKTNKQFSIELYHPTLRNYYLISQTQKEKELWITTLNDYLLQMKKDGEKNIQEVGLLLKGLLNQDPEIQIKSIDEIVQIFSNLDLHNNEKRNQFWQLGGLKSIITLIDSKCTTDVLTKAIQLFFWLSQYENVKLQLLELGIMKSIESLLERGLLQIRAAIYCLLPFLDDPIGNPKFAVKCCTKMMSLQITHKIYSILEKRTIPPEIAALLFGCLANCASYMQLRATMLPFPSLVTLAKQNINASKDFMTLYHSARLLANLSSDQVWREKIIEKEKNTFFEDLFSVLLTFRSISKEENCLVQKTVVQIISNLSLHPFVQKSLLNASSGSFNTLSGFCKENSTPNEVVLMLFNVFSNLVGSQNSSSLLNDTIIRSILEIVFFNLDSQNHDIIYGTLRLLYIIFRVYSNMNHKIFLENDLQTKVSNIYTTRTQTSELKRVLLVTLDLAEKDSISLLQVFKVDTVKAVFN